MRIDILTIFPQAFKTPFNESILKLAQEKNLIKINLHNLRDYAPNKHRQVDDAPYGGGPGMVMKPEPFFEAVETLFGDIEKIKKESQIILLSPQGVLLNQKIVDTLSQEKHLILLCGHYEGVDERVSQYLATAEISIGDYVLSGGELPAMVLVDAVVRKIYGVLGDEKSLAVESFSQGLLEYPQYTRPAIYRGWSVPEILLSGNHQKIASWRKEKSLERTKKRRPDLLK